MNKQELIDELAKYVKRYENVMDEHGQGRYCAYEVSLKLAKRLNESKITDEQAWNKVAEAYPESAQSLRNTLDNAVFGKTGEPQKPVVHKFVAEWFEASKHALDLAIFIAIRGLDDEEWPHKTDFENWLDVSKNKPIETLIRMKDGYEVEKEPVWAIKNADGNYLTKCALWGKDGVNYSFECNPSHRLLFTDKSIADAAALLVNGTVKEVAE